uniref:Uncharacterized protein n=1 Tax=Arundo donax TaxID=35708 RepID=A0A0A9BHJ1_ARUDO
MSCKSNGLRTAFIASKGNDRIRREIIAYQHFYRIKRKGCLKEIHSRSINIKDS